MVQIDSQMVFQIGLRSFPWARVLHPLPFAVVGFLLFRFCRSKRIYQVTGLVVASLALVFLLVALVAFVPSFLKVRSAYLSGRSSVVEGVVEDFRQAPELGPARESFSVRGIIFSYNALDDTPCFHNAPLHEGPIRGGMDVRIHYNDGCIQRVDVLR